MMFKKRINESPAMRKLFSNRGAVVGMSIISLYMLLFVWITGMQIVGWVGNTTGAFDLSERPVLGALLTEKTSEQVGAREEPGFGIVSRPEKRIEQVKTYFERAGKIFTELAQQEKQALAVELDGDQAQEMRTVAEIFAFSSLAERRVADVSVEVLQDIYNEGMVIFAQQDTLRQLRSLVPQIVIGIENLDKYTTQLDESTSMTEDDREILYDDMALTLDEIVEMVGEYVHVLDAEDDPLSLIDLGVLSDAIDALFDLEPMDPVYDEAVIGQIRGELNGMGDNVETAINAKLNLIEPILDRLYPMPTGVEGLIYKLRMTLGTDKQGQSIFLRALYSAKIAIQVGLIVAFFAVFFGSLIGAAAGYFGGAIDHVVIWLYSTFSSIPYLVLLVVLSFMFTGSQVERTLIPLYVAFSLTFWIGPCRVTRGEALKLRSLDYVQAAQALGASKMRILLKHILPNTSHLMFINSSLLFIGAIKGEVVLTYLGLGLKDGVSWGNMITQSGEQIRAGFFWQIGAATFFMFVLVLAFNILTDA
ncbi:MAG: ABC transporter permease, partial [Phycisphaerales bacterium]|nr:ABC transporter permease [Phycisphaerales bacterium]